MDIENRIKSILNMILIHVVVPFSSPSSVRNMLLANYNTNKYTNDDLIALCKHSSHSDLVRSLIIEDRMQSSYNISQCLECAVLNNNFKVVRLLAEHEKVDVSFQDYHLFYIISRDGQSLCFNPLFDNLPKKKRINTKLEALRRMMSDFSFKDTKIHVVKLILHNLKKYGGHDFECIPSFKSAIQAAFFNGEFKVITHFLKHCYSDKQFLFLIDTSIRENSLEGFNFLLDYSFTNKNVYTVNSDIFKLLHISTEVARPQFVSLFLSLIKDKTLSTDLLSHMELQCTYNLGRRYVRTPKEIEDDFIRILQIYIQDGRIPIHSAINNNKLHILCISNQNRMFQMFTFLLPYTDISYGNEITKIFIDTTDAYLNELFYELGGGGSSQSSTNIVNNSTILFNFFHSNNFDTSKYRGLYCRYYFNKLLENINLHHTIDNDKMLLSQIVNKLT